MDIDNKEVKNNLRSIIATAEDTNTMTREEGGFVVALVERFRSEIEKKIKQVNMIKGEIIQLQNNEKIIMSMINNFTAAAERSKARNEALDKLKNKKEDTED